METKILSQKIIDAKKDHPFYRASKEERLKKLDEFWLETAKFGINEGDQRALREMRGKDSE